MDYSRQPQKPAEGPQYLNETWSEIYTAIGPGREAFERFRSLIYQYYMHHERDFSWRRTITPYRVVVSEVMLQQTQTVRVAQKFDDFMAAFPDFKALSEAPFADVLRYWKGLGYNRRARYLQDLSRIIVHTHGNMLPDEPEVLVQLPGIGPATAASICVFAYNKPLPFIETNIRTVFIYFFFRNSPRVHDREILELVEKTLDQERPREWFYALMDYGVMVKKTVGNLNRKSRHYAKQSRFVGSDRQLRGRILQLLLERHSVTEQEIGTLLAEPRERVMRVAAGLCEEGIVVRHGSVFSLD